jgi:DNA-binding winged helix-turn-helix (wHTH) protein
LTGCGRWQSSCRETVTIPLGIRALDILILLTERARELVSTKKLISRVWRGVVIKPRTVRVQINTLRKTLDDGCNGARYASNVTGLGYCFVAPINLASHVAQNDSLWAALRVQALEQRVEELQQR